MVIKAKLSTGASVAEEVAKLPWVRRVALARGGWIVADATAIRPADVDALLDAVGEIPM